MRELDVLLVDYLERRYEQSPESEKAAFRRLLELPDPELAWVLEQSIRNYDPCISCATHFLDLTVERVHGGEVHDG